MLAKGDRVRVKGAHDIPAIFRPRGATVGVVEDPEYAAGLVLVHVPIGDDDPDEHSQAVPYPAEALESVDA